MEALILAGGFGTRLKQVVPDLPKPMAPIAGKPFLEILLSTLADKGFCRVVLSLGYMSEKVIAHFGAKFDGMDLIYEVEETPLGTGGAVRQALERCESDHVFVFNGDTYLDLEVLEVESRWKTSKIPIIVAREVPDTARYGRLEVLGNQVTGFSEKGLTGSGLINAGCYVLPKGILEWFPLGETFSLEQEFLTEAVLKQRFEVFVSKGKFIDIGIPDDYARAQKELAGVCA